MPFLKSLNQKQIEAVTSQAECTVVLAGPGSGKTRTLIHRIAYLIQERGVNPHNILAVTFTRKAAKEMRQRLVALLGEQEAKKVTACTFHSWGAYFLRQETHHLSPLLSTMLFRPQDRADLGINLSPRSLNKEFAIYDNYNQKPLIKTVRDELELDPKRYKLTEIKSFINRCKNGGTLPDNQMLWNHSQASEHHETLRKCYILYQAKLIQNNACDFDDLILYPLLLLGAKPQLLKRYQKRISHLLVDEYQDTNTVQYELSTHLAVSGQIFVVGDEDQAIYGFRYADFQNVKRLMDRYPKHHLVLLEQNYRSNQAIVQAANNLIKHNTERVDKTLWTLNSQSGELQRRTVFSQEDEANEVVKIIKELHSEQGNYKEIAVLYRVNAQSRELEKALVKEGIPYDLSRGTTFFERQEVKDVLAYLQFIHNGDLNAFKRLTKAPRRGIGQKTLAAILNAAQGNNMLTWLNSYFLQGKSNTRPDEWKRLAASVNLKVRSNRAHKIWALAQLLVELKAYTASHSVTHLVERVIELLVPHIDKLHNAPERMENVKELLTMAVRVDSTGTNSLAKFMDEVALITLTTDLSSGEEEDEEEDRSDKDNRVVLSTMHGSKGLEWDTVIITGCEEGLSPHYNSSGTSSGLEEERRLFYVAFTRARKNVYLLRTRERMLYGQKNWSEPSRFLRELAI